MAPLQKEVERYEAKRRRAAQVVADLKAELTRSRESLEAARVALKVASAVAINYKCEVGKLQRLIGQPEVEAVEAIARAEKAEAKDAALREALGIFVKFYDMPLDISEDQALELQAAAIAGRNLLADPAGAEVGARGQEQGATVGSAGARGSVLSEPPVQPDREPRICGNCGEPEDSPISGCTDECLYPADLKKPAREPCPKRPQPEMGHDYLVRDGQPWYCKYCVAWAEPATACPTCKRPMSVFEPGDRVGVADRLWCIPCEAARANAAVPPAGPLTVHEIGLRARRRPPAGSCPTHSMEPFLMCETCGLRVSTREPDWEPCGCPAEWADFGQPEARHRWNCPQIEIERREPAPGCPFCSKFVGHGYHFVQCPSPENADHYAPLPAGGALPLDALLMKFMAEMRAKFFVRADRHKGGSVTDPDFDWSGDLDIDEIRDHLKDEYIEWDAAIGNPVEEPKEAVDMGNMSFLDWVVSRGATVKAETGRVAPKDATGATASGKGGLAASRELASAVSGSATVNAPRGPPATPQTDDAARLKFLRKWTEDMVRSIAPLSLGGRGVLELIQIGERSLARVRALEGDLKGLKFDRDEADALQSLVKGLILEREALKAGLARETGRANRYRRADNGVLARAVKAEQARDALRAALRDCASERHYAKGHSDTLGVCIDRDCIHWHWVAAPAGADRTLGGERVAPGNADGPRKVGPDHPAKPAGPCYFMSDTDGKSPNCATCGKGMGAHMGKTEPAPACLGIFVPGAPGYQHCGPCAVSPDAPSVHVWPGLHCPACPRRGEA